MTYEGEELFFWLMRRSRGWNKVAYGLYFAIGRPVIFLGYFFKDTGNNRLTLRKLYDNPKSMVDNGMSDMCKLFYMMFEDDTL